MATPPPGRPLSNTSNMTPRTTQGLARNPSLRGRSVRRTPVRSSIGVGDEMDGDESKDLNAQLIADLKEQVERAEYASEQYRKQLKLLQQRLDDATDQQTVAEEREFAARTQTDKLAAEVKDSARQKRDLVFNFESERNVLLQEKSRASARENELQTTVKRLTDMLQAKNVEKANIVRTHPSSEEDLQSAPQTSSSNQEELLQVLQEKEATIDALRLELADVHFKVAEQEHMGDGNLQTLEKQLSDVKMQNARLVEENDSFQMLLSEKTLKGDFMHDTHSESGGMSSLAEELESIGENDEISMEQYKKLEADLKSVREEKKALTLYVDKIIGRLLQHDDLMHIITGKDADENIPPPPPKPVVKEKPLPLAPAALISGPAADAPTTPTVVGGFLSRAKSVVSRAPAARGARPMSFMQAATVSTPTANENPQTAPSVPINRGHRRARSDQMQPPDLGAAAVVQHVNKGSPLRTASGGPTTGISPLQRAQTSYFAPPSRSETIRAPSQSGTAEPSSSANSVNSGESYGRQSTEATSAQTSTHTRDRESMAPPVTAGVMKQSQLRPLRLVQNQDEEERKKANRQSWMGNWFNRGSIDASQS
ncbi:hypothetical protein LTR64_002624 [Lithohypha guttulata]|uniref:uncharacterized protein n=1 Tax=Lithohypha guttulata TaxID=1690604 RepID=UPI00315DC996